jgi:hypothetical protein
MIVNSKEYIEDVAADGSVRWVPAYRYRAMHDGTYEVAEPAHWDAVGACLSRVEGRPPVRDTKGEVVRRGSLKIASRKIVFKAGETNLIPASEIVHATVCHHADCATRKRFCRDEAHESFREIVGGATWLVRADVPEERRSPLSAMLIAHEARVALELKTPAVREVAMPTRTLTGDALFAEKVREARAARGAT